MSKNYFGSTEEQAFKDYLATEDHIEKSRIFSKYLEKPILKMSESIIRKYGLFSKDLEFNTLKYDVISFVVTRMNQFKPEKNTKAYSYLGTICKNYLLTMMIKENKYYSKNDRYEDYESGLKNLVDEVESENLYVDPEEDLENPLTDLSILIKEINKKLNTGNLSDEEKKVGSALVTLFQNWDILSIDSNNKFTKNVILYYIRELTMLTTKEIRTNLKKFKVLYNILKNNNL